MNCWEFKKCRPSIRSNCPAYLLKRGLECWKLTGTLCNRGEQEFSTLSAKIEYCHYCDFYREYAEKY